MVGGQHGETGSHVLYHVVVELKCPVDRVLIPRQRLEEPTVKETAYVLGRATKSNVLVNTLNKGNISVMYDAKLMLSEFPKHHYNLSLCVIY